MIAQTVKGRRASDKVHRYDKIRRLIFGVVVAAGLVTVAVLLWPAAEDVATAYDGAPSWSPDGQRLVFSAERDGQTDILVMSADGTGRRSLTTTPGEEGSPAFSPDGRRIAFETNRDGNFEIYTMDAEGHSPARVTNSPSTDRSPAWSPDGRRIAFLSDRDRPPNFDVYVMNADGSGLQRLTTAGTFWAPQFSPDGKHLAVQGDRDIRVITSGRQGGEAADVRAAERHVPELVARRLADGVRQHAQRTSRDLHDAGGRLEPGHAGVDARRERARPPLVARRRASRLRPGADAGRKGRQGHLAALRDLRDRGREPHECGG